MTSFTPTEWDFTPEELRIAARVARSSRGLVLPAAAAAWEMRADLIESGGEL